MEQMLIIVLAVAAVAVLVMYLMRSRSKNSTAQPPAQAPAPQPAKVESAPKAPAEPAFDDDEEGIVGEFPIGSAAASASAAAALAALAEASEDEAAVLKLRAIELHGTATSKDEAIAEAGRLLIASGAVTQSYVDSMYERERSVSTYMGNLLAIPHGTNEAMAALETSAISVVRYPNGLEWNGNPVKYVIGIAGAKGSHLELLGKIAEVFLDQSKVELLEEATNVVQVRDTLAKLNA